MKLPLLKPGIPALSAAALSAGAFAYLWLRVDPSLYKAADASDFQATWRFFSSHLSYPGGIAEYLEAYLSVFFSPPVTGAAIISVALLCISLFSCRLFRCFSAVPERLFLHLFPVPLLVGLHSNYHHAFSSTLGLLLALAATVGYFSLRGQRVSVRACCFPLLYTALYLCAGGNVLLFAFWCIFSECLYARAYATGCLYAVAAAIAPLALQRFFFLIAMDDAWLSTLPFRMETYAPKALPFLLYAFYPALALSLYARAIPAVRNRFRSVLSNRTAGTAATLLSLALLAVVSATAIRASYHPGHRVTLTMCKQYMQEQWRDIIAQMQSAPVYNVYTVGATNLALFQTGNSDAPLLSFRQPYGANGLFFHFHETSPDKSNETLLFPLRCDIFFRLGLVNIAEQWAYEAIAVNGESAWMLRRLAQIHALKGELPAAAICLNILETMPRSRTWAREFRRGLGDGAALSAQPELRRIRASMPGKDFIVQSVDRPALDLERLVLERGGSSMAAAYLCWAGLLDGNLPSFARHIAAFGFTTSFRTPRLYQEALALYTTLDTSARSVFRNHIGYETLADFNAFNMIMDRYHAQPGAQMAGLAEKFGATYWFYYLYALQKRQGKQ